MLKSSQGAGGLECTETLCRERGYSYLCLSLLLFGRALFQVRFELALKHRAAQALPSVSKQAKVVQDTRQAAV